MRDQRFTRTERLTHPRDIEAVFANKRSNAGRFIVLYAKPNDSPRSRLAIVIGKKAGNSVIRHRFKRIVREAFRLSKDQQPTGWDWIVLPRLSGKRPAPSPSSIDEWTMPTIREELLALMQRLARRKSSRGSQPSDQEAGHVPTPPDP
jgi:ribonuclease P protein component